MGHWWAQTKKQCFWRESCSGGKLLFTFVATLGQKRLLNINALHQFGEKKLCHRWACDKVAWHKRACKCLPEEGEKSARANCQLTSVPPPPSRSSTSQVPTASQITSTWYPRVVSLRREPTSSRRATVTSRWPTIFQVHNGAERTRPKKNVWEPWVECEARSSSKLGFREASTQPDSWKIAGYTSLPSRFDQETGSKFRSGCEVSAKFQGTPRLDELFSQLHCQRQPKGCQGTGVVVS